MTILEAALRDAAVTREVLLAAGAAAAVPGVVARVQPGARWLVVADGNTWAAGGRAVHAALRAQDAATPEALVFEAAPRLKPRVEAAQAVAARIAATGALPLAVGSGVLNDVVKYAAALAATPYVCVATAASMDGYAASGAALLQDGFKRTLACPPPLAIVADPQVLASAPPRMVGWGYGDLAGKVVAGADWLLADALGVEPVNRAVFGLVQDHLAGWLGAPERLAARDPAALGDLLAGLLVSGFAMQAHGNSRPASGSDHQFSHLWEMEGLQVDGEAAAHGACVGVGCVTMLGLYEWFLAQPASAFDAARVDEYDDAQALAAEIRAGLGEGEVAAAARAEMQAKRAIGGRRARVQRLAAAWPRLGPVLQRGLLPASEMQRRLRLVGAPASAEDLGLTAARLAADCRRARLIRRRYTLLDTLEDLGWLDRAIEASTSTKETTP